MVLRFYKKEIPIDGQVFQSSSSLNGLHSVNCVVRIVFVLHIPVLLGKYESWEGLRHLMVDTEITFGAAGESGCLYRWINNVFI